MKNIKQITRSVLFVLLATLGHSITVHAQAQCYDVLGSSPNILTSNLNRANQVIVNNELNTVIFIHRNDVSLFGGDGGVYKYDISTDNGATWQLNQGYLNPNSTLGEDGGRFPQVGIYNPAGNTDAAGATLVYHGATNSGVFWNGYVTGSLLLDGAATSTENYNQAGVTNTVTPGGFCQSTPGTFWAIDGISDDGGNIINGIRVLKGTYSAGDVVWSVNTEFFPDFDTTLFGYAVVGDWNMAFDPTGQYGWIVTLAHLNGLPGYNDYPVFYRTVDGGTTWTGPEQLDPASFSSITSVEANPACSFEVDLAVDMNGNPHALVGVFQSAGNYSINPTTAGHLFDFTYNGSSWNAINVSTTNWLRMFGDVTSTDSRPQISRSDDGSKLVFTWVASDLPPSAGLAPNLKAVTYDVPTGNLSCPYDYSQICPDTYGAMYQTSVSPNLIEEGGVYTVPVVITTLNGSGSGNDPAQHYYLNSLSFTAAQFSAANSPTYPTISANGPTTFCQPGSVELTASASSSYFWSTGETTQTITADGGVYWVVNPDDNFCVGTDNSVSVVAIFPPDLLAFTTPVLCDGGGSVDLYASYYSFGGDIQWSTGETTQLITVTTPGTYSLTVDGCAASNTVEVTTGTAPANDNICNAESLTVGNATPFYNFCATAEANEPTPPVDPFFDPASQTGWFDETGEPSVVLSNTVWFTFIAPASGAVSITTDGFDSQLALWGSSDNSCTGAFTLIAANDDGFSFFGSYIYRASCLEAGRQYFVQVDGLYGQTGQATITVSDAGALLGFTLVDADTDTDLGPLFDNTVNVIDLALTPHVNIRADVCQAGPGSVVFQLDGVTERVENVAPFALAGDNPRGNYKAWNVTPGDYQLLAIPFSGTNGTGDMGIPLGIVYISVINTADCDPYLRVVNNAKSWRKLKLGNNPNSLWTPVDVTDGGNNTTLCVTLRDPNGNVDWSKIQIRAKAAAVTIGDYGTPGTSFTQVCIPLSAFAGTDFSALSVLEIPYSNGHGAFEIDVERVEFTGGANPYLWFGAPKTDNVNDGQTAGGSALSAELVTPDCGGSAKLSETAVNEVVNAPQTIVNAYPNPFSDKVVIEFVVTDDSPVSLQLYSLTGQKLATVFEGTANGGQLYTQELNTSRLASGFYLYKLQTKDEVRTEKILLAR